MTTLVNSPQTSSSSSASSATRIPSFRNDSMTHLYDPFSQHSPRYRSPSASTASTLRRDSNPSTSFTYPSSSDDSLTSFHLDISKLENTISRIKGVACRIRRSKNFEKHTYFLLRADFVDYTSWDILIPHPFAGGMGRKSSAASAASRSRYSVLERGRMAMEWEPAPKIISWHASPRNEAGVAYFLVESTKGFEEWEYMDWICFACVMKVQELQLEHAQEEEEATLRASEDRIEKPLEEIRARESTRSDTSEGLCKSSKSVRFGQNDVFLQEQETEPLVVEEKTSLFESWKVGIRRRWTKFKECLRSTINKIEEPIISTLMRWGY